MMSIEREVVADRTHRYAVAPSVVYNALTNNITWWMHLHAGELEPRVLEAVPGVRVVWSSLWPVSPDDTIEFDLLPDDGGTAMRFRWYTDSPPDERGIGITRQRLNQKFGGDLRGVTSEHEVQRRRPPSSAE